MSFNIGDVVVLKSGGPSMTVSNILTNNTHVGCVWFINDIRHESNFVIGTLKADN